MRSTSRQTFSACVGFAAVALCAVVTALALTGCSEPPGRVGPPLASDPVKDTQLLESLNAVPVQHLADTYFRSTAAKLKNCTECHTEKGLINPKGMPQTNRKAHWDVTLNHNVKVTCKSCHDATLPDLLPIGDERVAIEHSYKLCGSCHGKQFEDWKGGAHGKRLSGWGEPRVITTCVECHDPHNPHFKPDPTVAPPTIVPDRLKGETSDVH